jgi:hypothetical protein
MSSAPVISLTEVQRLDKTRAYKRARHLLDLWAGVAERVIDEQTCETLLGALVSYAHDGEPWAMKLILDRVWPEPTGLAVMEKIAPVEPTQDSAASFLPSFQLTQEQRESILQIAQSHLGVYPSGEIIDITPRVVNAENADRSAFEEPHAEASVCSEGAAPPGSEDSDSADRYRKGRG